MGTRQIGIFGASGFAREVGDIAHALGYEPAYIARDQTEIDAWDFPEQIILEQDMQQLEADDFAIGVGANAIRQKISEKYSDQCNFINIIHPSATFGKKQLNAINARKGVIVCAGARLTNNIEVGNFNIFNLNATVGHDVIFQDFVNVAPGANISGNVYIEKGCWIGSGAVVNQGDSLAKLRIGSNTIIGSGSVVIKSCEKDAVYIGVPAKRIK